MVQKNSCMFEFPASLPPTNLGLPMHSPSAPDGSCATELGKDFLLDPVDIFCKLGFHAMLLTEVTQTVLKHPISTVVMTDYLLAWHSDRDNVVASRLTNGAAAAPA